MPPAIVYFPPYTSTIQLWNLKICVSSTSYLSNGMIAIMIILESELKRKYTKAKTRCQPSYLSVLSEMFLSLSDNKSINFFHADFRMLIVQNRTNY